MINFDVVNKDFRAFVEKNAKMYNRTPEYMEKTPTAKEYWKYLIDREKDKISKEGENGI